MSAGDFHPLDDATGTIPTFAPTFIPTMKDWQWYPGVNASPSGVPSLTGFMDTGKITTSSMPDARDDRIATLEAEVKRLGRECKRLQRKLARNRGR